MEGTGFKSVLDYIKNFFSIPPQERDRKRRAPALDFDNPIKSKVSRLRSYATQFPSRIIPVIRETDDMSVWLPSKSEISRESLSQTNKRLPMTPLRTEEIVIDDDEIVMNDTKKSNILNLESRREIKRATSTPVNKNLIAPNSNGLENGNDDVIFVKSTKSPAEKRLDAKMYGFNYLKPSTSQYRPLFNIGVGSTSKGSKPKDRSKFTKSSPLNGYQGSSVLNYSFRLEDKLQYKKLLEQTSNDSSFYQTPNGSHDFANLSDKKSKTPLFGLEKSQQKKETTKERIIKVLDSLENDTVVVKDSDSEDSLSIVNPPSPKPDIKVDPVNSLKAVVNTSAVSKKDWLNDIVEKHNQYIEERQREIDNLRQCSQQTEEINKDINIELLRRKVNDCLQLKDIILPEIISEADAELPQLTDEQVFMVQRAFRGDPNEVLARKFNLNITRRDLMTLAGLNWLNDEVINFYMNLIIERGKDSKWPKSYAFNTFFYMKLIKDGPQSLRRWTKRVDLFSYDLVCVPIHLGMHWCMAIIDFRDKSIRYYDSMGSPNNRCLEVLRTYLEAEHLDKKGSSYDTNDFDLENMRSIPQQMNGSDCGMFACTFAEFTTRNAKISFEQEDMPYLRKKMVVEIMSGELLIN